MSELLLEILCEEIPARMQVKAGADLARLLSAALEKSGLSVDNVHSFSGPRRLVFVADVPAQSPDVREERKGPRVGAPEQALAGFMRGAGLTDISQAETRSDKKGEYYVAVLEKPGREASEIIAEVVPEIMAKFPWPKSMKSGATTFRWVRPLTSILCVLDGKVVPFTVGGIDSGNITHGHRRMGAGPFSVTNFKAYKNTLETKGHVILDACERKDIILRDAQKLCADAGLALVEDEGLLAEVAGLAEWPTVLLGDMDAEFLELPAEVIQLSMRTHQKYFAVNDKDGNLAAKFVVVANQVAPDGGAEIARGNARVLSARLDDARFFQAEDVRDGKKLIDNYDKLDGVIFHQKLGTIKDKAERVAALARELAPKVGADPNNAEQAAKLAKCDLVTNMVVEFTSLQGKIGRLMYEKEGGDKDIAIAIEDHYKPQGPSDRVPTNPVAVAVALADKLDTLVGFWAIDEKPTGSKDPFALRRAALGVVRIILENGIKFDLTSHYKSVLSNIISQNGIQLSDGTLIKKNDIGFPVLLRCDLPKNEELKASAIAEKRYSKEYLDGQLAVHKKVQKFMGCELMPYSYNKWDEGKWDFILFDGKITKKTYNFFELINDGIHYWIKSPRYISQLTNFILDRLKVHLRDEGVAHDHIDAVFALGGDDLVDITNRVKALGAFLSTDDGANLLAGYKRAANILKAEAKKGDLLDVEPGAGTQPQETALFSALETAGPLIGKALASEDYAGAMTALAGLRAPIDAFFDDVIVNSDVAAERENRLGLLIKIRNLAGTIADFDKVEG
ncbi:MAG: glycine--tRNA ligase subunit beta [Robiginitomaculum sp.]|nr:glycine--tRNA ligase subunit beta [Robiginitomaculum sp.]